MPVTSDSADKGLSSVGVVTPPWLDTLECDIVFVIAGRQKACKHYRDISFQTVTNLIITTLFSWIKMLSMFSLDKLKLSRTIKRKFLIWNGEKHCNLT
jgi:hypothetical protein